MRFILVVVVVVVVVVGVGVIYVYIFVNLSSNIYIICVCVCVCVYLCQSSSIYMCDISLINKRERMEWDETKCMAIVRSVCEIKLVI